MRVAQLLARSLRPATGYRLPVGSARGDVPDGSIALALTPGDRALGDEGYRLVVTREGVTVTAARPAGLFYGGQTLRQLLPAAIESGRAATRALADRARDDPRPPALRLARHDARRRPALPRRRRGRAADRPDVALQAQPAASPPVRRPGLADLDPLVAAPDDRRREVGGRRREGRVLHPARLLPDRRVRARPLRRRHPGDRHAGARQRRARVLPEARRATASRRHPARTWRSATARSASARS